MQMVQVLTGLNNRKMLRDLFT